MPDFNIEPGLIFDLGMHHGLDTGFYLAKGFRVVALEANPALCAAAAATFAAEIAQGRLTIVQKALWERDGETVSFYVNPVKDDWSSVSRDWAEKGGHQTTRIDVGTLTLSSLFDAHGVPYYVKCDIEGADLLFAEQLARDGRTPDFVSVEAISPDLLANFTAAGYDIFQIVNQALNGWVPPPNPAREGRFVEVQFNGHMSGLFGHELDPGKWISYDECLERYTLFKTLMRKDPSLAHGWLDFHAGRSANLMP